jgi:uncharacterized membrane protein YbaN (DUF454 family)
MGLSSRLVATEEVMASVVEAKVVAVVVMAMVVEVMAQAVEVMVLEVAVTASVVEALAMVVEGRAAGSIALPHLSMSLHPRTQ